MYEKYLVTGLEIWSAIIFLLYIFPPSQIKLEIGSITRREKKICCVVIGLLVAICIAPMSWNPHWTGGLHKHQNQYQELADAFLSGKIYIDKPVNPRLAAMKNPYDPQARAELNFGEEDDWAWDHAFYKGRFYVYFGAVPALLVFLPYKLIVGEPLAAYHGTQIFVAFFIIGVFALFFLLAKNFFPRLPFIFYLIMSSTLSFMSISYCIKEPALYCTASSSGLCMEVWSLYFFISAARGNDSLRKFLMKIFFGATMGALAFGCKPTVGLASFLVVTILPVLLKKYNSIKVWIVLIFPYLFIGLTLMTYNYLRFDSVLEFGQSYQLTIVDQHNYGKFFDRFSFSEQVSGLLQNFFGIDCGLPRGDDKPVGIFRYAIFWFPIFLFKKDIRSILRINKLNGMIAGLAIMPVMIEVMVVQWAPVVLMRYEMEWSWLAGMMSYVVGGMKYEENQLQG